MVATRENIIEACEFLHQSGVMPTMDKIREQLGGGSYASISPILRYWKEQNQDRSLNSEGVAIPVELVQGSEKFITTVWKQAVSYASSHVESAQRDAERRVNLANGERDEAISLLDTANYRVSQLEKQLLTYAKLQAENDLLKEQVDWMRESYEKTLAQFADMQTAEKQAIEQIAATSNRAKSAPKKKPEDSSKPSESRAN